MRDFPGGLVTKTLPSNAGGLGSIPGGRKRSHMSQLRPDKYFKKCFVMKSFKNTQCRQKSKMKTQTHHSAPTILTLLLQTISPLNPSRPFISLQILQCAPAVSEDILEI
ncbi:unnamed protein product [Rangifer tarandus platyrhynchus]|uniref:Uncharacterized protein n=1 Tax=Rangifer tarandus platyrhynchus TaxID=3082113 RepID=A0AC59YNA7_RANTA